MLKLKNLLIMLLAFVCFSVPVFASGTLYPVANPVDDKAYYVQYGTTLFTFNSVSTAMTADFFLNDYANYTWDSDNSEWVYYSSGSYISWSVKSSMTNFCTNNERILDYGNMRGVTWGELLVPDGEEVPPMSAPVVADLTDFTTLIVKNSQVIATVGCLVLSLILSPILVKKLWLLVRAL